MTIAINQTLTIRGVTIRNRLFLAPVDGVFDQPSRLIAVHHGVGLTCSEMMPAPGIKFRGRKLFKRMQGASEEKPYQVQLAGHDPEIMAEAARQVVGAGMADIIDINMGCPSKLVTRSGNGAALMKEPERVASIVREMRAAISIPLSVKIRAGWDDKSRNALEIAHIVEEEGADMITVHPRTRSQAFGGHSDWSLICDVKERAGIPVVGNGDVVSAATAQKMLSETGCDAVMIGRGAFGNPWLIDRILKNDDTLRVDSDRIRAKILEHIELECLYLEEKFAIKFLRKHLNWYVKGLPRAAAFRQEAMRIAKREPLEDAINRYFDGLRQSE